MDYNIGIDNKDFHKVFEIFCAKHKNECMQFLKGDAFYLKTETSYSDDMNQILHRDRMLLNTRLKQDYERLYPKSNSSNLQNDYEREMDFGLFKKSIINYLSSDESGYNSVKRISNYDPQVDPINVTKNKETGEFIVQTVGRNFNIVDKIKNSVDNFITKQTQNTEVKSNLEIKNKL